ncbi:MAG TPA: M15 family metallopeptidase [Kofleriaceae bacterium]
MLALGIVAPGCTMDEPQLGVARSASTVGDYVNDTGCSTAVVIGLSEQIARQAACDHPQGGWVSFAGAPGITLASNAVLPYLVQDARDELEAVAANNSLDVTSALRTLAQQYLLLEWFDQGNCGITAAANVGDSNHEGGRAVDLSNYGERITAMADDGWAHDVAGDPVHFDHTASADDRSQDTQAFQELWNANNPNDQIGVDGDYGPQTEARLRAAPATGFPIGASCTQAMGSGSGSGSVSSDASVVSVLGPDQAPPATVVHYTILVKNSGQLDWPAGTLVELAPGSTVSPLYDGSWLSQTDVTTLGDDVAPGSTATIEMDVTTPSVTSSTSINQVLALADGDTQFGTIDLALTVAPNANPNTPGDNEPGGGIAQTLGGGCNAGGNAGGMFALVGLAFVIRRRKR